MKRDLLYAILALAVLALAIVPVGSAVFLLGFVYGDSPCVMCWEQRSGMALIALIGLFILRYGPRPRYIGLSVAVAAWGLFMGMRHVGMHAARDIGQGFSAEILGAHTYTWALFIFWVSVALMGLLLLAMKEDDAADRPAAIRPLGRLALIAYLVVIAGNIVQAFASTGPPPFMGQGDPVRFSFNPSHWVWSLDEWSPASGSLRGRWAAEKPGFAGLVADPAAGPLTNLASLAVKERKGLAFPLRGTVTDLAYDAATDRFLVTTQSGVYITDGALAQIVRYTVVDPGYSVDFGSFAGAAFLDSKTVMAVGENKSFVVLRENDQADAGKNFRFFLESFDKFDELRRSRFGTVRARMMYTMSLAYDPAGKSLYTITVPNAMSRQLVVSRFDQGDRTLSEEFTPTIAAGPDLMFADENRSLNELYVTGATVADGRLYAISAAYSTLVAIDLASRTVVAAYAIPGLEHPTGLAVKGGDFYIAAENGTVAIVGRPGA